MSCPVDVLNIILLEAYIALPDKRYKRACYEIFLRELAHPLTQPDALRLTPSFASHSTLDCRGRSLHFQFTSADLVWKEKLERLGPFPQWDSAQLPSSIM